MQIHAMIERPVRYQPKLALPQTIAVLFRAHWSRIYQPPLSTHSSELSPSQWCVSSDKPHSISISVQVQAQADLKPLKQSYWLSVYLHLQTLVASIVELWSSLRVMRDAFNCYFDRSYVRIEVYMECLK